MTSNSQDHWTQWLLHRRFGGDLQHGQVMLKELSVWRDRILEHATITGGETVLDGGCGDGLIAFGALDRETKFWAVSSTRTRMTLCERSSKAPIKSWLERGETLRNQEWSCCSG